MYHRQAFIILIKEINLNKNQSLLKIKNGINSLKLKIKIVNILKMRARLMTVKYRQGRVTLDQLTDARNLYANNQIKLVDEYLKLFKIYFEYFALNDKLYNN